MNQILLTFSLTLLSVKAFASYQEMSVQTFEVYDFDTSYVGSEVGSATGGTTGNKPKPTTPTKPTPTKPTLPEVDEDEDEVTVKPPKKRGVKLDDVSKAIEVTKDLVALGEDIYTLVQKGKPSNTTKYTPISVVPLDPETNEVARPLDLEWCSMPEERKYETTVTSYGWQVIKFQYAVMFTHNCSFNGTGKFIQSALIKPIGIKTSYGWDLTATMTLDGITNHGSRQQPVAGAMLSLKYSMNSWFTALEKTETIHITGKGKVKHYGINSL